MKLNAHILIVDDDLDTLNLLELTLKRAGYKVTKASNWGGVNQRVREVYEQGKKFDAVILDIMMPERSGYDVLTTLHVLLHPMPPVIMLSALKGIADAAKARELGAVKYLTKPIPREKLLATLREVIK